MQIHKVEPKSVPNAADQHSEPPNSLQNSLNGTSVFLEPHITVESSQGASGTKVTATAKFKLELHTPTEQQSHSSSGSSHPSSRSRSRRSSSSGSSSIAADALRSSGDSSLASRWRIFREVKTFRTVLKGSHLKYSFYQPRKDLNWNLKVAMFSIKNENLLFFKYH